MTIPARARLTEAPSTWAKIASKVRRSGRGRQGWECCPGEGQILAVPPRLRAFLGRSDRRPLKDSRTKVSSARRFLSSPGACRLPGRAKPMTPTKRRRRMDSAERRGLRQALALDHRARVIEPAVLLAQMRHRRLVSVLKGARSSCSETAKAHASGPSRRFAASAMGTPLSRHALDAGVRARPPGAALPPFLAKLQPRQPRSPLSATIASRAGPRSPRIAAPSRKISTHKRPDPNHSNQTT